MYNFLKLQNSLAVASKEWSTISNKVYLSRKYYRQAHFFKGSLNIQLESSFHCEYFYLLCVKHGQPGMALTGEHTKRKLKQIKEKNL